ncbi:MAG: hypothetical protein HY529_03045 [Chloroflexi bacterium]|nr:hypothetical protein [Chloroflexota bacterium]
MLKLWQLAVNKTSMVVKKVERIPIECVLRGYLAETVN